MNPIIPSPISDNFVIDLIDHSKNPPGQDPVLKAFYQAMLSNYQQKKEIYKIVQEVKEKRASMTNQHLINLLFRAYQFIKFRDKDLGYKYFTEVPDWTKELDSLFDQESKRLLYLELLLKKSTNTTIYQRYNGPFALIKHLYGTASVSVLDVGCGGNYGLRGGENEPFKKIVDHTPNYFITEMNKHKIKFDQVLAVDRENPDDEDVYEWRLACSFYPKELDDLPSIVDFEATMRQNTQVRFIKSDFLKVPLKRSFDAIIFCVMLYQHKTKTRQALLEKAKTLLKPGGIIIVQDFANKDPENPTELKFDTSWFGEKYAHKTFVSMKQSNWVFLEVLKWDNGRCREVYAGEDFTKLLQFPKIKKNFNWYGLFGRFFARNLA